MGAGNWGGELTRMAVASFMRGNFSKTDMSFEIFSRKGSAGGWAVWVFSTISASDMALDIRYSDIVS